MNPNVSACHQEPSREIIIQQYWPRILRAAAGYELNTAKKEELAQDMALEIWRALASFNQQCALHTYIYRVIHNVAVDHIRRAKRELPVTSHTESSNNSFDIPVANANPELMTASSQQQSALIQAIHGLPLSLRQVLLLKLEDLSNIEIAETLGLSESNVGVRVNRAKQQLANLLKG